MNFRIVISTVILLTLHYAVLAQDFDADSIYYTPIPKVKPVEKKEKARPFTTPEEQPGDTAKNNNYIQYFFNIQVGSLIGCSDCVSDKEVSFTLSTVHGATIGEKLRVGGGIGFDSYYDWQTMPVFASASWDVFGSKNTNAIFFQVNYGWSAPWRTETTWEYMQMGVDGGQMLYFMGGLRLKYYDMRISLTLGGKYQTVSSYFETPTYYYDVNGNLVPGSPSRTTIEETMRRFAVTLTVGWK